MALKDLSNLFRQQLDVSDEKSFTQVFELDGEYNLLYICEKKVSNPVILLERQLKEELFPKNLTN